MHRALQIEDILIVVCSYFNVTRDRYTTIKRNKRTLLALARTCKTFCNPALNKLWEQATLLRLLNTLPSGRRTQSGFSVGITSLEDWERLMSYAARIRALSIPPRERIAGDLISRLVSIAECMTLFPSLRHLSLPRQLLETTPHVKMFISSALQTLNLNAHPSNFLDGSTETKDGLTELISHIVSTTVCFRKLFLSGTYSTPFTRKFASLSYLEDVDLGAEGQWTDAEGFFALAQLPSLSRLRISTAGLILDEHTPSRVSFPSLASLDISGAPITFATVLKMISSPNFFSLKMSACNEHLLQHWYDCLDCLRLRFSSTITYLAMKILMREGSWNGAAIAKDDLPILLEPLRSLSKMQAMCVDLEFGMILSDQDLHEMAVAWPQVKKLHFWCHAEGTRPRLATLAPFASHCPHLVSLAIPMDALVNRTELNRTRAPRSPHPLGILCLLGDSQIVDAKAVALVLRKLFPALHHLEAASWEQSARWSTVMDSMGVTSDTRESSQWDK